MIFGSVDIKSSSHFLLLLISPHYLKCLISQILSNVVLLGNYKMKNKKYDTIKIVLKSNTKIIETEAKSIHDRSVSWLDTGFSLKANSVKLVL